MIDRWDRTLMCTHSNFDTFKNGTAKINDILFVIDNETHCYTSDLLIQNGNNTGILTSPDVPDWHGERSDLPCGLVYDYPTVRDSSDPATHLLFEINSNNDSRPVLITVFETELYFTAFKGSSRKLYVSDWNNNNVNSASYVFLHKLVTPNCSTDEDPTLKCDEYHGGHIICWMTNDGIIYFLSYMVNSSGFDASPKMHTYSRFTVMWCVNKMLQLEHVVHVYSNEDYCSHWW